MLKLISDLNTLSVLCEVCDTSILNRIAVSFTFNSGLRLAHEVKNSIATIEVCDPRAAQCGDDTSDDAMLIVSTTAVFVPQNFRGKTLSVREAIRLLTDENARVGVAESSETFVSEGFHESSQSRTAATPSDETPARGSFVSTKPPAATRARSKVSYADQTDDDESMSSEDDYI